MPIVEQSRRDDAVLLTYVADGGRPFEINELSVEIPRRSIGKLNVHDPCHAKTTSDDILW